MEEKARLGISKEKTERVLNHAENLFSRHTCECAYCMDVLQNSKSESLQETLAKIVSCISKAEGIAPYLYDGIISKGSLEFLLITPLEKMLAKINKPFFDNEAYRQFLEDTVEDEEYNA